MIRNAISKSPARVVELLGADLAPRVSMLLTSPQTRYTPKNALAHKMLWAWDNGCYTRFEPEKILRSLHRWQGIESCVYGVLPDVWADAKATLAFFDEWNAIYKSFGFKTALAAQDGLDNLDIPFDDFDALFIGGSDDFKESDALEDIVNEAHRRELWIHDRRCNFPRAILRAIALGCHSFDGQAFQRESHILAMLPYQFVERDVARSLWRKYDKRIRVNKADAQLALILD